MEQLVDREEGRERDLDQVCLARAQVVLAGLLGERFEPGEVAVVVGVDLLLDPVVLAPP